MEAENLSMVDTTLNVYDIKTRARIVEPEELLKQQRHWDRKMRGTLGAFVKHKKIDWFDVRPETGEINPEVIAKLPAELAAFLQENSFKLSRKSQIRKESDVKWQAEIRLAQEIKMFDHMKEIEGSKKVTMTSPTMLRDPVLVEPEDEKLDNITNVIAPPTPPGTTTVVSGPTYIKESRWRRWTRGEPPRYWGGLSDAEYRFRHFTIALGAAILLFGLVAANAPQDKKLDIRFANPARWFSPNESAQVVLTPVLPTTATVATAVRPISTVIPSSGNMAESTKLIYDSGTTLPVPERIQIDIPSTTAVQVEPKPFFTLKDDDPLYRVATGNPKISDVEGQVAGELMREAGIPYRQSQIDAFNQILTQDPVIRVAVDKGMASFKTANPDEYFAIVRGRIVERHEINGNLLTYKAPAEGWASAFGTTATERLRLYFFGK